jgi:hypothetical protein
MLSRWFVPLVYALTAFLLAYAALFLPTAPLGAGYELLPFCAGIAAFLVASLCWRLLLRRRPAPSFWAGCLTGLVIVLLTHPLTWYFAILVNWFFALFTAPSVEALNPLTAVPASLIFSAWSLFLTGWLNLPAGALAGGLLAVWQRRRAAQI